MKLFQFVVNSNNETVNLKNSYFCKEFTLKSISVVSKADYGATNYLMQADIECLDQGVNVHSSESEDHIVIALDKTTGKRITIQEFDILFRNIEIPGSFRIRLYDDNGDAFDNTKIGAVVFTFMSDSK
jgi:hypothetical protein